MNLATLIDGDLALRGVDLRTHPAALPPGMLAEAVNLRLTNGKPRPRGGIQFASPALPGAAQIAAKGPFYLAAVYRPVDGHDRILLVAEAQAYLFDTTTGELAASQNWALPGGTGVKGGRDVTDFIQASGSGVVSNDGYLLRGAQAVWHFQYDSEVAAATGFPASEWGMYYQNRIAVKSGAQQVSVSHYLDFTTWSTLTQFNVARGGGDYLVAAVPFQDDKVLIFGRKSIWLAYFGLGDAGYTGGLDAGGSWLRLVTNQFGCVARRSVVEVGGSIYFLSEAGVAQLTATLDLNLLGGSEPVSAPLQPVMDLLNTNAMDRAAAVTHRERVYFALPLSRVRVSVASVAVLQSVGGIRYASVHCAEPHGMSSGDTVELSGLAAPFTVLNGQWSNVAVVNANGFTVQVTLSQPLAAQQPVRGAQARPVVSRPNTVLVLNTVNRAWESVDELPTGVYADWLCVADQGGARGVWLVDRVLGPARYEWGTDDELGTVSAAGWPTLPQTLTFALTSPGYDAQAVAARLTTRRMTWGDPTKARRIRQARARFELAAGDAAALRVVTRTPADEEHQVTQTVSYTGLADDTVRVPVGVRGMEAHLEVEFESGAPKVSALYVEALQEPAAPQAQV